MPAAPTVCPACGARLADDAAACDLCGHDLALPPDEQVLDDADGMPDAPAPPASPFPPTLDAEASACPRCNVDNVATAKFCHECGLPLRAARASSDAASADAPAVASAPSGARLWTMIGGAMLLVAGLFALNVMRPAPSASTPAPAPGAEAPGATAAPGTDAPGTGPSNGAAASASAAVGAELAALTPAQERQLDSLRTVADGLSGVDQTNTRRELARLQFGFGRPDRAGETMEAVAQASTAPDDWKQAGDFLSQWMDLLPEEQRAPVATRIVQAYERVLAANDGDLDTRARLGWAAQYDPTGNPMRAVTEMQAVLQRDSTHVLANYNRVFLLLKIGRYEQARAQLLKVQRLAGPESPVGRQAAEILEELDAREAASGAPGASAPTAPPPGS